jgi:hypothetical protein
LALSLSANTQQAQKGGELQSRFPKMLFWNRFIVAVLLLFLLVVCGESLTSSKSFFTIISLFLYVIRNLTDLELWTLLCMLVFHQFINLVGLDSRLAIVVRVYIFFRSSTLLVRTAFQIGR